MGNTQNDFINVGLTEAGSAAAGGHPVSVNGRTSVTLVPGQSTRVARYEWDMMLQHFHNAAGEPLFEIVG